jgi:hypothetical protein
MPLQTQEDAGDGICFDQSLLQSHEDLQLWLLSHVLHHWLYGVSIFASWLNPHMDSQKNKKHFYKRHLQIMDNLFLGLFRKTNSDGMNAVQMLPGFAKQ